LLMQIQAFEIMMKSKIVRGAGFRGALDYIFDEGSKATKNKRPDLIGGTMVGNNPAALAREFSVARDIRPYVAKLVRHCSLSIPAGERISEEKWGKIALRFMREMGFSDETQWVAVRHNDTDHDHIHIVASRIGLDAKLWHGQWEARKSIEATQL